MDNTSPDQVELDGVSVLPEDESGRAAIAARVTQVTAHAEPLGDRKVARVWVHAGNIVAEVLSESTDIAGRGAPLICHAPVPANPSEAWPDEVITELLAFADRIGRTVSPACVAGLRDLLLDLQKKKRKQRPLITISVLIAALLAVALAWYLTQAVPG